MQKANVKFFDFLVKSVNNYIIKKNSRNGIEVKGIVFDIRRSNLGEGNVSYPIVRFLTDKGEWITEPIKTAGMTNFYKKGAEISKVYQAENPTFFSLKINLPILFLQLFVVLP